MRARIATGLLLSLVASWLLPASAPAAPPHLVTLAQESGSDDGSVGQEDESQNSEATTEDEGSGQSDADAETGAGGGEQEGATEEEGPPWTYQMARIGLVLMVLVGLGIGLLYYRMIVSRQRETA